MPETEIRKQPDYLARVCISRKLTERGTVKVPLIHLLNDLQGFLHAHSIPEVATIEIEIPGGGDCSGERIAADEIDAVITWEITRDVD